MESSRKLKKANCAVCDDSGDGLHFGAEACRACAAFFRRTVALKKEYECRQNGNCTVNIIVRSICKQCRLEKCLEVGMKSKFVQPRREKIVEPSEVVNPIPDGIPRLLGSSTFEAMPILERMRKNYEKLENSRRVIHRKEGENIFEPKIPREIDFRESLEMASNEVSLIADWVEWCFAEFVTLPVDQKNSLFKNFEPSFVMLERAFLTCFYGEKNQLILPSKDYLRTDRLEEYFTNTDLKINGAKLAKIFQSSLKINETLCNLIRTEQVDLYCFLGLTAILFWDQGLEDQTPEVSAIGRKIKLEISKEIVYYLTHIKKLEDPLSHMVMVVSILPCLYRAVYRFREDMSMAHIFDFYTIPSNVYSLVVG